MNPHTHLHIFPSWKKVFWFTLSASILVLLTGFFVQQTHALPACMTDGEGWQETPLSGDTCVCGAYYTPSIDGICSECPICEEIDPITRCVITVGDSCTSVPNNCGQTNNGVILCDGSCSAVRPADSLCITDTSCDKDPGNVYGIAHGQDAGKIYFEPVIAAQDDPSYCIEFGVTINQNNTVTGQAFSPYYGLINFSSSSMIVGRNFSAFSGTIGFRGGSTVSLDTIDPDAVCGLSTFRDQFPPFQDFICVDNLQGTMSGYIFHPQLGYISFGGVSTSWRPTPLTPKVVLNASPLEVCNNNPITLSWFINGTVTTGCTATSTDGSFTGPKEVLPSWGEVVTPTQIGEITYTLSCGNTTGIGSSSQKVNVLDCGPAIPTCTYNPNTKTALDDGLIISWLNSCGPTFANFINTVGIHPENDTNPDKIFIGMKEMTGDKSSQKSAMEKIVQGITSMGGIPSSQKGFIHEGLVRKMSTYVCMLENEGVDWSNLSNNMHLRQAPLELTDPGCGQNLFHMACNTQNQCVQVQGVGQDSCTVANQLRDCDVTPPTAIANPTEGSYTTTTAVGKMIYLTVTDFAGGTGVTDVKWIFTPDQPNTALAKTAGTSITPTGGAVTAAPIPYPTSVGSYFLNVYSVDHAGSPRERLQWFGPYNVTSSTTYKICKLIQLDEDDYSLGCFLSPYPGVSCSQSSDCVALNHLACDTKTLQCVHVLGAGSDECTTEGSICGGETHMECNESNQCVSVPGFGGVDLCSNDADCTEDTHSACSTDGTMCVQIAGAGMDSCTNPTLDCSDLGGGGIPGGMCHVTATESCNMNDPNSLCSEGSIVRGCSSDPYPPDPFDPFDADLDLQHNE